MWETLAAAAIPSVLGGIFGGGDDSQGKANSLNDESIRQLRQLLAMYGDVPGLVPSAIAMADNPYVFTQGTVTGSPLANTAPVAPTSSGNRFVDYHADEAYQKELAAYNAANAGGPKQSSYVQEYVADPYSESSYINPKYNAFAEDEALAMRQAGDVANNLPVGQRETSRQGDMANQRAIAGASNLADYRRNLRVEGGEKRYQEAKAREDTRVNRIMQLMGLYTGAATSLSGGAANAAQGYQQQANQQAGNAQNTAAAIGQAIAGAGVFNGQGAKAGNSRTNSEQTNPYVATNPYSVTTQAPVGYGVFTPNTSLNPWMTP